MNVPNIGQSSGSAAVLARTQRNDVVVSLREGSRSGAHETKVPQRTKESLAAFTRIGWFDVNGDGSIDGRSALAGGDATLLLPHVVKVANYSRPVRSAQPQDDEPVHADQLDGKADPTESAETDGVAQPAPQAGAQTRQAIAAYERYGQPNTTTTPSSPGSERAA
jgi:hypothetical protein